MQRYLIETTFALVSVNRCYYSLYYALTAVLLSENIFAKTHQGAHVKFNEVFIKGGIFPKSMAIILTDAFSKRQSGDYEVDFEITRDDLQLLLENTQTFITNVEIYLSGLSFDAAQKIAPH
jgi:uncharacterized protein (UPF0332 family)